MRWSELQRRYREHSAAHGRMPIRSLIDAGALPAMDAPAFIDVEASGLGGKSYPIEVGLITSSGEMYCALLRPDPNWSYWDTAAESVHHITRPILEQHGKPLAEVAHTVNRLLRGQTVYTDAWGNDYPWLCKLFDAAEVPMLFKLESSRKLLDEAEAARWASVKQAVDNELRLERHRASSDARVLQLTLMRVKGAAAQTPEKPKTP